MSAGYTAQEFVKLVWYAQEKVLLDFDYRDDKFQEVIVEANMVLDYLQKEEDWTWLRRRDLLGLSELSIPHQEFTLADDVYKLSTVYGDAAELEHTQNPMDTLLVPYVSSGMTTHRNHDQVSPVLQYDPLQPDLGLVIHGRTLRWTRPLTPYESNRWVYAWVIKNIEKFPTIDESNWNTTKFLTEIPDPMYVVASTAARHAEGSPLAQGRLAGLQSDAQRLLSGMRSNDASYTGVDYVEHSPIDYINVV